MPELQRMPSEFIHAPWLAPKERLSQAGMRLGEDYPYPIIDHAMARKRALEAFARIKRPGAQG
ncbi:MAG: FAD-binding domain-containing protein [Gammaproteobacteria bacterium]